MEVITERIQRIYDESRCRSVRAFALMAGLNVGTFNDTLKKGNEPRFALLEAVLKSCPNVSAEWLMRGEGDMYRDSHSGNTDIVVKHEPIVNQPKNTASENSSIVGSGNVITADKSVVESLQRENAMLQAQLTIANEQLRKKDEQINALFGLMTKQ